MENERVYGNAFTCCHGIVELDEKDKKYEGGVAQTRIVLKPHQKTMLYRCVDLETREQKDNVYCKYGALCDKVGAGKSYVILYLISLQHKILSRPLIDSYGYLSIISKDKTTHVKTSVLVVPHSLQHQWAKYVKEFPNIVFKKIGTAKDLDSLSWTIKSDARPGTKSPNKKYIGDFDAIVLSASFYKQFITQLIVSNICVKRMIYDEADEIKIPSNMDISRLDRIASFTWFVTASCEHLFVHVSSESIPTRKYVVDVRGGLKSIFQQLNARVPWTILQRYILKNKDSYVDESFNIPKPHVTRIRCRSIVPVRVLHGIANTEVMRRLHANDVRGAMQLLNVKQFSNEDNVIESILSVYVERIRNCDINTECTMQLHYTDENDRAVELKRIQVIKQTLEKQVQCIRERIQTCDACCICYDELKNKTITTCCSNSFCFTCINNWMIRSKTCPLCKQNMDVNNLCVINEHKVDELFKEDHVVRIITKGTNKKVLLFSEYGQFDTTILQKHNITYDTLTGNSNSIRQKINTFTHGDLTVLLVNPRYFGCGLNLANTTDIIMFHQFDDVSTKQIIGRAQRPGRTSPLNVWFLLNEYEEKQMSAAAEPIVTSSNTPSTSSIDSV